MGRISSAKSFSPAMKTVIWPFFSASSPTMEERILVFYQPRPLIIYWNMFSTEKKRRKFSRLPIRKFAFHNIHVSASEAECKTFCRLLLVFTSCPEAEF